jgi:hypothetical protein
MGYIFLKRKPILYNRYSKSCQVLRYVSNICSMPLTAFIRLSVVNKYGHYTVPITRSRKLRGHYSVLRLSFLLFRTKHIISTLLSLPYIFDILFEILYRIVLNRRLVLRAEPPKLIKLKAV